MISLGMAGVCESREWECRNKFIRLKSIKVSAVITSIIHFFFRTCTLINVFFLSLVYIYIYMAIFGKTDL